MTCIFLVPSTIQIPRPISFQWDPLVGRYHLAVPPKPG